MQLSGCDMHVCHSGLSDTELRSPAHKGGSTGLQRHISPHGGQYMYRQFNSQQFYVLPTQCIYVFCVDLRTNSDYFTVQL